ncbi:hypothetical protein C922_05298 [Plasmodium inui San Antonio 1]|uniref:Uncharacterized protein n=1 Tax=Plasmodium inui San Antonio 1 TaxID=1237626 RepID=W7A5G6_9APIC|nr:hypothetical protein C922_05298 [Plasmodium inui San Antonio 1]EUD64324.1 hypothetical protein C922_05298 [Plasmodium inui San Antonio 1]
MRRGKKQESKKQLKINEATNKDGRDYLREMEVSGEYIRTPSIAATSGDNDTIPKHPEGKIIQYPFAKIPDQYPKTNSGSNDINPKYNINKNLNEGLHKKI